MDKEAKYEAYKLTVKRWEHDFKKNHKRIPSKWDIKDAPISVKQAYKMYFKMKTDFLTQSLCGVLDDDSDEMEMSQTANTSVSISELLDPSNSIPLICQGPVEEQSHSEELSAVQELSINDAAWGEKLNKRKPVRNEEAKDFETQAFKRKMSLNFEPSVKAIRNPKKSLMKFKSSANFSTIPDLDNAANDALPDLETILTTKSRSHQTITAELKLQSSTKNKVAFPAVDFKWLDRNTSASTSNDLQYHLSASTLVATNFGLDNLNRTSLHQKTLLNSQLESNTYSLIATSQENEIIGNSEDEAVSDNLLLPVSKKRRLSKSISNDGLDLDDSQHLTSKTNGTPTHASETKPTISECYLNNIEYEKEEDVNYLYDSDIKNFKTVPRASIKELKTTEKLFHDYMRQDGHLRNQVSAKTVVDSVTAAKKDALMKKIKSGTLNENYKRINLKKKVFVRGKKTFSFSKYKKAVWKSKKVAALSGSDMDMRGCDGGTLRCFNCDGIGHFAQNCKQKGDNLLPVGAAVEEESAYPTLEEASQLATEQKITAHNSRKTTHETCMEMGSSSAGVGGTNKENHDVNSSSSSRLIENYIGQQIPEDFLKKSGLLELSPHNEDKIQPVYDLNPDGSVPPAPEEIYCALKRFGHREFRNGQEHAIMRILSGKSTLVTLGTGSGKSLCYQLPAYIYRQKSKCITLVVSPLVALMDDQIHGIPDFINAQCLHSNQTEKQREKTMEAIKAGLVEILLVSPEAIVSGEKSTGFGSLLRQLPPIAFACIDEAHCVSQWSHNFRPSYLMICRVLREKLGVKTVLGLTATATLQTRKSIVSHLEISDGLDGIISDTPLPDNLTLTISQDENRDKALLTLMCGDRFGELRSVIVYCTRRDECERIAGILRTCMQGNKDTLGKSMRKKRKRVDWSAEAYHAGLPATRRRTIQSAFMSGELRIVVATIAFGMGINKSNIRGVIHYNMPKSFESYVQEVGRAGRDGLPAHCHVFLDSKGSDLSELRRHIYSNSIDRHVIRKLLKKVFISCSCSQHLPTATTSKLQKDREKIARNCPSHEVCFSIDETVQELDIPEENISTLLCYLELHEQRYIKVLGNAYTKCKVFSYGGPKHLKQVARNCPPLAIAIALDIKKRNDDSSCNINALEFSVVDVAAAIGWDSGVVKHQLKQLEWTTGNGTRRRSSITVTYSDLGFRVRSPGDLSDEELDAALDSLEKRTSSQEKTQLVQLQIIFDAFKSLSCSNIISCSSKDVPSDSSEELKVIIRNYFQTNLPMNVELDEEESSTDEKEILSDVRQMIGMYPENIFSGRALARLFHGISSPCYPAVIWGRCKYWRAHINVNFNKIVALANTELVNMRRIE